MITVFEHIGMGAKKYGGFEKYIMEEARVLKEKGCRLVVIFDRPPLDEEYINDLKGMDVSIEILPQSSKTAFCKGFIGLLKKYRPDVVHTNFSSALFLAHPLARLYGVKRRIITEHCLPNIKGVRSRIGAQLMTLFADNVLAVSKRSCEELRKGVFFRKKRVLTLYLGIPDFSFDKKEMRKRIGISDDTFALMNVAYHNPVKGVDVLLKALSILVHDKGYKDIILYQIGGSQMEGDTSVLKSLASDLGIANNIEWMGLRNDVPMLLSAGDLYVQPSRSEGISLSIMEASMAKLAVVGTKVGGIPEAAIENRNASLVPPEDPRALAEAIEKLYLDPEKRKVYGERGLEIAQKNFSLQRQVRNLIADYYRI